MEIKSETYTKWIKLANKVKTNKVPTEDIVSDFTLAVLEGKVDLDAIQNNNYVFIIFRNYVRRKSRKPKPQSKLEGSEYIIPTTSQEEHKEYLQQFNNEAIEKLHNEITESPYDAQEEFDKLQSIKDIILQLKLAEQQLYVLHFIHGLSQRYIARRTGIGLNKITRRIAIIKKTIIEHHKNKINKNE